MAKVFISYAHEDQESALRFYRELSTVDGIEPWLDKECLQPGMKWRPAIRKAIREADFLLQSSLVTLVYEEALLIQN